VVIGYWDIDHWTFGLERHTSLCRDIKKQHLTLISNAQCSISMVLDFHVICLVITTVRYQPVSRSRNKRQWTGGCVSGCC